MRGRNTRVINTTLYNVSYINFTIAGYSAINVIENMTVEVNGTWYNYTLCNVTSYNARKTNVSIESQHRWQQRVLRYYVYDFYKLPWLYPVIDIFTVNITDYTLVNATFTNVNSTNVSFDSYTAINSTFINCFHVNVSFANITLLNVFSINSTHTNSSSIMMTQVNTTWINTTNINVTLSYFVWKNVTYLNLTSQNCSMTDGNILDIKFVNVTSRNRTWANVFMSGLTEINVTISDFATSNITTWNITRRNVTFINSTFFMCTEWNVTQFNTSYYNVTFIRCKAVDLQDRNGTIVNSTYIDYSMINVNITARYMRNVAFTGVEDYTATYTPNYECYFGSYHDFFFYNRCYRKSYQLLKYWEYNYSPWTLNRHDHLLDHLKKLTLYNYNSIEFVSLYGPLYYCPHVPWPNFCHKWKWSYQWYRSRFDWYLKLEQWTKKESIVKWRFNFIEQWNN